MHWLKHLWVSGWRRARDEYEDTQDEIVHCSPWVKLGIYSLIIYAVVIAALCVYWSFIPPALDVKRAIAIEITSENLGLGEPLPKGVATTSTLIAVTETLLKKPGGYLANDMFPPGVLLDDMPSWEFGVLLQVRDMTQMLRGSLSQVGISEVVDVDLQKAEVRFNFPNRSWAFPSSESQYLAGIELLKKYNSRLMQGENRSAHFYADSQHLSDYLASVEQRLKNLSQRLTASVGPSINTDASALSVAQENASEMANGLYTKTPWFQLDDVFYEARGSSWALIALMQGIEQDFGDVLQSKNAQASFDQIIRELKPTQQTVYSPVILNGEGFGFVANHSLVMASYLARAQAAIADCRRQLLVSSL